MRRLGHRQTLVKVNAPVDEGIADVVSALNGFPKLYTTQSCQGREDGFSFVWFRYGDDLYEAADFLVWLTHHLAVVGVRILAECAGSTLRLELRIERDATSEVAKRLRVVSRERRK